MRFQIGAMSVGDILDRGVKLLLARLSTFYVIYLIMLTPLLILQLAMPALGLAQPGAANPAQVAAFLGGTLLVLFLTFFILQPLGTAAILHVIAQEFVDRRVGVGEAFAFAFRWFGSLLFASILAGLMVMLGFLLCFVPAFIFLVWYVFVGQVVVVEGLKGDKALSRSKELTSGFRWRVFGVFALLVLITLVFGAVTNLLERILPAYEQVPTQFGTQTLVVPVLTNYGNYVINLVVGYLLNILVGAYAAICWTLFYFDLRIRKEGFDLELAAKQQAPGVS
jgi:hypothetical protein